MNLLHKCTVVSYGTYIHENVCTSLTSAFSQEATGPSRVCEGSDVTLQCVIIQTNPDNTTAVQNTVWSRNGMSIRVTNSSGTFLIPNHSTEFNSTTGGFTDLVITDVTLEDDNIMYTCTAGGTTITSSVVLNVTGKLYIRTYT